jgi:hypothetical protein
MVLAGKIFRLREPLSLRNIAFKLKDLKREESFDKDPYHFKLITEVKDIGLGANSLRGILSQDFLTYIYHRGETIPAPRTVESTFAFTEHRGRVLLTVLEKKRMANNIANLFSEALFITKGGIVEARIPPENLRKFHEENREATKVIFFDDVDIPNIEKLSLYGESLANTGLYEDYLSHGYLWYVVVTSRSHGIVVGVTRDGVVTVFSKIEKSDYLNFVESEVFPLIP